MANLEHPTNREEAYLNGFIDSGFNVPEPVTRKEAYLKEIVNNYQIEQAADYALPESFGAVGDGSADDVEAIEAAIATGKPVYLTGKYYISRPINMINNTRIYGNMIGRRYDQPIDSTYIKSSGPFFTCADTTLHQVQLFDFSLWDTNTTGVNPVFDCRLDRSDIRIMGYNISTFCDWMQSVSFDHCYFINCRGPFSSYLSDCNLRNSYFSGIKDTSTTFLTGSISALRMYGCYIDFWGKVFNITGTPVNNIVEMNIFDACYHVFVGKYSEFSVYNNVFMRIKDSTVWTLNLSDWCVFCNGLRSSTRSIGNKVEANYYIHTSLTGDSYPNKKSLSAYNLLASGTLIKWNPYPNDAQDLQETRIEELNYKTYTTLPAASLTSGSSERFNHQFAFSGGNLYINNSGTWLQLS